MTSEERQDFDTCSENTHTSADKAYDALGLYAKAIEDLIESVVKGGHHREDLDKTRGSILSDYRRIQLSVKRIGDLTARASIITKNIDTSAE